MNHIGIDIGRVIICPTINGHTDTNFLGTTLAAAMTTQPAPDAFDVVRALVERFEGRVWLVSKCGPSVQKKTLAWLAHWRFYESTGVPSDHIRFCLKRHQKRQHTDELGITDFIDDRLDVLQHLVGGVERLFWFGEPASTAKHPPHWTIPVRDWSDVRAQFALPPPPTLNEADS